MRLGASPILRNVVTIQFAESNRLQPTVYEGRLNAESFRFAIVASRWNELISARLVEGALDALPDHVRPLLENVAIVIDDEPSEDQLRSNGLGPGEVLYGLYEGTPAAEYGADLVPFPNKISLFRLPLEADFADPQELAAEVRRTVLHELAHHAGLGDERLDTLGM